MYADSSTFTFRITRQTEGWGSGGCLPHKSTKLFWITIDLCCLCESLQGVTGLLAVSFHRFFSMLWHCSSIHSSFAAFIFFLTSLFTFLCSSHASLLEYFCCLSCHLVTQINPESHLKHRTESFFSAS